MRTILKDSELYKWTGISKDSSNKYPKPKTYGYTINGSKELLLKNLEDHAIYNFLIEGSSHKKLYINYESSGLYELNFFLEDGTNIEILSGTRLSKNDNIHIVSTVFHKPSTHCTQDFRFVVDDEAISSFKGVIVIDKDATDVESYMNNKNLLLSKTAKAYSKPQLNIENNKVACSHGSSTGALDKEQMFYLQSRGITEAKAKDILVDAFVGEVTPDE